MEDLLLAQGEGERQSVGAQRPSGSYTGTRRSMTRKRSVYLASRWSEPFEHYQSPVEWCGVGMRNCRVQVRRRWSSGSISWVESHWTGWHAVGEVQARGRGSPVQDPLVTADCHVGPRRPVVRCRAGGGSQTGGRVPHSCILEQFIRELSDVLLKVSDLIVCYPH